MEHGTRWQPLPWRWLFDGIFKMMPEQLTAIPMELQNVPNGGEVEGRIDHLRFCDLMSIGRTLDMPSDIGVDGAPNRVRSSRP